MTDLETSRTLSVRITRDPATVYAFVVNPAHLPRWATGVGSSIDHIDDQWIAQTEQGPVTVRFAEPNALGVLDHWIEPATGPEIYVPMRVVPHDVGSEVLFTLRRRPESSDEEFAADAAWVAKDLHALKTLLEDAERQV